MNVNVLGGKRGSVSFFAAKCTAAKQRMRLAAEINEKSTPSAALFFLLLNTPELYAT